MAGAGESDEGEIRLVVDFNFDVFGSFPSHVGEAVAIGKGGTAGEVLPEAAFNLALRLLRYDVSLREAGCGTQLGRDLGEVGHGAVGPSIPDVIPADSTPQSCSCSRSQPP